MKTDRIKRDLRAALALLTAAAVLLLAACGTHNAAADALRRTELSASAVLLADAAGEPLFARRANKRLAPASLTKLLTALTALAHCDASQVFTVGDEIDLIGRGSSVAYLQKGWQMPLGSLIAGMLAASGNDAAYTIAVNTARSLRPFETDEAAVLYFVSLMNEQARGLGMERSRFATPDGYDAPGQFTTAADLMLLARAALCEPAVAAPCGTYRVGAPLADGEEVFWTNTNRLLCEADEWYRPEVTGLKTGTTDDAGSCILTSFELNGETYILAVLGAENEDARYRDVCAVIDALKGTEQ